MFPKSSTLTIERYIRAKLLIANRKIISKALSIAIAATDSLNLLFS